MTTTKKRIAFYGLICLDAIFEVDGYPPEDSGLSCDKFRWNLGGNASNNCVAFSRLREWFKSKSQGKLIPEIEIELIGTMSNDLPAMLLREILDKNEIKYDRVVLDAELRSPVTCVVINLRNGSRSFFHYTEHYPDLSFDQFLRWDPLDYGWIHLEGRRNAPEIIKLIRYIRTHQRDDNRPTVSIELEQDRPGLRELFKEEFDYYFIERDFAAQQGWNGLEETIKEACKLVTNEAYIVFVWGEAGSRIAKVREGQIIGEVKSTAIFPPKNGVVDTCGAGDSYLAGTVFDIFIHDNRPEEAIVFGSKVAGAKVGMPGYEKLVHWEEMIDDHRSSQSIDSYL